MDDTTSNTTPLTDAEREEFEALEQLIPALKQHLTEVDATIEQHSHDLAEIAADTEQKMDAIDMELDQAEADVKQRIEQEAHADAQSALS